eukprot:CAMPEP_0197826260 /NCGR_PEP_ID=MMETSP1437-20131217/3241_1 /TAXON_ID=49252 ORGANISM="Eucampia antarctica, Strain CCMP1452" /NCGR_SAMPLE_ID=MMETSP1437 /ASSEMBLY_ACC=CAM_ASM_001096 /LENGTH=601 /DNA_ID=CAMNT_0043426627 /DNA_START=57 /DNA_END=1862 /DNA_ORIENTATION=+
MSTQNDSKMGEDNVGPLVPIGIDIGSMYVRVAYCKPNNNNNNNNNSGGNDGNINNNEPPQLVTNEMGQRSTLSLVAMEDDIMMDDNNNKDADTTHFIFGDAAYKYLMRQHPKTNVLKEFNLKSLLEKEDNEDDDNSDDTSPSLVKAFLVHVLTCTINAVACSATQLRMVVSSSSCCIDDDETTKKWQTICENAWVECCDRECPILKNKKKKKQWMQQYVEPIQPILAMCNSASASLMMMEQQQQQQQQQQPSVNDKNKSITILDWGASGLHKTTVASTTTPNSGSYGLYRNPTVTSNMDVSGQELQTLLMKQVISIFCRQVRSISEDELLSNKKKKFKLQMYMPEALRTLARGNVARIDIDEFHEGCDLHIQLAPVRWEMMLQNTPYWKQVKQILSIPPPQQQQDNEELFLLIGNVWQMPMAQKCIANLNIINHDDKNNNQKSKDYEEIVVKGCAMYANQLLRFQQQDEEEEKKDDDDDDEKETTTIIVPTTESIPTSPVTLGMLFQKNKNDDPEQCYCKTLIETNVTSLPAYVTHRHEQETIDNNDDKSSLSLVQILPSQKNKVLAEISTNSTDMDVEVFLSLEGSLQVSANGGPRITIG